MTRLERLRDAGVSIRLDMLSRELLDSGAFRQRGHRRDLESDHLRQGDHDLESLRRATPRRGERRDRHRGHDRRAALA
jgi:hypothetical protein